MSTVVLTVLLFSSTDVATPTSYPLSEVDTYDPYGLDQDKSCGLRCCVFLDQYLGGNRTFEDALAATHVSSYGTNLEDLAELLKSFGYQVAAKRPSAASLKTLANPALLAVRMPRGDHFVVAIKYDPTADSFLIFDPPRKLIWVSYKSLESRYRKYALIVCNGRNNESSIWTRHLGFVRNSLIASAIIGMLLLLIRKLRGRGNAALKTAPLAVALATAVSMWGCNRSQMSHAPKPEISTRAAAEREREVGPIVQGTPLQVEFHVRNKSDLPFDVIDIKKSCTCQTVTLSKSKNILPNEELCVTVEMNSNASVGPFERSVSLVTTSADPSLRDIRLSMQGEVVTLVRAIPSQLSFGEVEYGSRHRKHLRIEGFAPGIVRQLKTVSSSVEGLSCEKTVTGELADIEVEACFEHCGAGDFFGQINLEFDHPSVKTLSIPINARVRSRLRAVPSVLLINGRANNWSASVCLQSTDGSDFKLESVQAPTGIVAEWNTDPASRHIIDLSTKKGIQDHVVGFHRLSIATDAVGGKDIWIPLVVQR